MVSGNGQNKNRSGESMSNELDNKHQWAYPSYELKRVGEVERVDIVNSGLTKREVFAAMAMQALIGQFTRDDVEVESSRIPRDAVAHADALLKELEK